MTKLAASGIATAFALVMLGGSALATLDPQETAQASTSVSVREESDNTPLGQCRIQYDTLAADRQPAAMECEHAHWVAQRWGGRVMESTGAGMIERASYDGANDFTNVPTHALPRAGYCRAWIDGVEADAQPAQGDCRQARRTAANLGGRVIFMPL